MILFLFLWNGGQKLTAGFVRNIGEEGCDLPATVVGGAVGSEPAERSEGVEKGGASVESTVGAIRPGPIGYAIEESIRDNLLNFDSVGGARSGLTARPAVSGVGAAEAELATALVGRTTAVLGRSPACCGKEGENNEQMLHFGLKKWVWMKKGVVWWIFIVFDQRLNSISLKIQLVIDWSFDV